MSRHWPSRHPRLPSDWHPSPRPTPLCSKPRETPKSPLPPAQPHNKPPKTNSHSAGIWVHCYTTTADNNRAPSARETPSPTPSSIVLGRKVNRRVDIVAPLYLTRRYPLALRPRSTSSPILVEGVTGDGRASHAVRATMRRSSPSDSATRPITSTLHQSPAQRCTGLRRGHKHSAPQHRAWQRRPQVLVTTTSVGR